MNLQLSEISHPLVKVAGIKLFMARADKLHPLASGNKFYKLNLHLEQAKQQQMKGLLSFGGAYSNHIHALALTAKENGLKSIGIIRGEPQYANNPTLSIAKKAGMKLEFINRQAYQQKNNPDYLAVLQNRYPEYLIIPEGGSSQLGVKGCMALAHEINTANAKEDFDTLLVASGTGATLAGLVCGAKENQNVIGYVILRDESIISRLTSLLGKTQCDITNYHLEQADFGGLPSGIKT